MHRYALIDAAARPDTAQALRYYTQGHVARSLFERQPEAHLADKGPWLAELDGNVGLDGWLRALERQPGAVARLESQASFKDVFEHLEACIDIRMSNGKLAMLRYWDGRAFWRLQGALKSEQRKALLGPIRRWSVYIGEQPFVVDAQQLEAA